MKRLVVVAAVAALAACQQKVGVAPESLGAVAEDFAAPEVAPAAMGQRAGPAEQAQAAPVAITAPQLAYAHRAVLELPPRAVETVLAAHEAACVAAGPANCQVVASSVQVYGEDAVSGALSLRAAPAWLDPFRAKLDADADAAGGRVRERNSNAEDLTRQIVDTQARVAALTTLRDRLQTILAERPGRLQDLLEVERELARVQGELDAARSGLAVMRARVDTSVMDLAYETRPQAVSESALEPLTRAFAGFLGVSVSVVAVTIYGLAVLLPLSILLAPLIWLLWRAVRRRRAKADEAPTKDAA